MMGGEEASADETSLIEEHLRLCDADDSMIEALQNVSDAAEGTFAHTVRGWGVEVLTIIVKSVVRGMIFGGLERSNFDAAGRCDGGREASFSFALPK